MPWSYCEENSTIQINWYTESVSQGEVEFSLSVTLVRMA